MARWLVILGALLIAVGAILHFAPWLLNWFGRLPGDIRVGSDRVKIFVPITSMILISILLTLLVNLLRR
jgi:hypothetical protein